MKNCKVDVLGTTYTVEFVNRNDDKDLKDISGYCDKTSKRIAICNEDDESNLDNYLIYQKETLRHEIIHAFMNESGLRENYRKPEWGQDETIIDWFALQAAKIYKAFVETGCL